MKYDYRYITVLTLYCGEHDKLDVMINGPKKKLYLMMIGLFSLFYSV